MIFIPAHNKLRLKMAQWLKSQPILWRDSIYHAEALIDCVFHTIISICMGAR
jgi:hypothetical protein